jgi:hypothetical protein
VNEEEEEATQKVHSLTLQIPSNGAMSNIALYFWTQAFRRDIPVIKICKYRRGDVDFLSFSRSRKHNHSTLAITIVLSFFELTTADCG